MTNDQRMSNDQFPMTKGEMGDWFWRRHSGLDLGHWSLGFGHSLVIGNWSLVIGHSAAIFPTFD
jgi:hypothetical protein